MLVDQSERHTPWTIHDRQGGALDLSPLRTLLARIEARFHPDEIWLFGSRARGDGQEGSDWDLFVVVPDSADEEALEVEKIWELRRGSGVRADVIACHRSEFLLARDTVNTLAYEAAHAGVRIDER